MGEYLPVPFEILIISFFGLVLGSFASAVTHREAVGESWFSMSAKNKRWSKCPQCEHRLAIRDLVPVLSWLISKGTCRYCKKPIAVRYPITEMLSMLGCLGLYGGYGFGVDTFILMVLVPFLIALFWIDMDQMILPNRLVAICLGIAIAYVGWIFIRSNYELNAIIDHLAGFVVFPAVFAFAAWIITKILKKSALGMGDVKFLAPAGLFAGLGAISTFLILSGLLGVLTALLMRKFKDSSAFPFGPALIVGLYAVLILKPIYFQ